MAADDPLEKAAQDWFKKGSDAMQRQNWDFAVECYTNSVKMKPGNLLYRQTKHGCCRKLHNDNGTGVRMASMKLMGLRGKIKKARSKKDWTLMDQLAEEGMVTNPWDAQLHADIGVACAELEHDNVACYAWEQACKNDNENIPYLKAFGEVLAQNGQYDKARSCFEKVYKLDPADGDARSRMSQLDAEKTMNRGYDGSSSTKDVKLEQPEEASNAYEEDRRARRGPTQGAVAPGESEEADLTNAIRKDPENLALYQKLIDHYRSENDFTNALQIVEKAIEVAPLNEDFKEAKDEIGLDGLRERLGEANERFRKHPDRENLKTKVAKLSIEVQKKEVEVLAKQVQNHPNDMKLKFELAQLHRKSKKFALAIPLFQQAVADSRHKEAALVALGECFIRSGKADLGRRQFIKALETLNATDDPDPFKTAHYFLGRVYEKAGKNEEAENHYNDILMVDYDYRDVLQRLEKLQGGADEFDDIDVND